jgi:lipopolysaccharide biosynthesis glycosyltransferase
MLLRPSRRTFAELHALMLEEAQADDTCMGHPGCNDQRVLNVYYHNRSHDTLELTYNIFCDQLITLGWSADEFDADITHWRGYSKPWALDTFAVMK